MSYRNELAKHMHAAWIRDLSETKGEYWDHLDGNTRSRWLGVADAIMEKRSTDDRMRLTEDLFSAFSLAQERSDLPMMVKLLDIRAFTMMERAKARTAKKE